MKVALLLVASLGLLSCAQIGPDHVRKNLPGRWREDQYKRKNLNNFLYYMGLGWFKRIYVTSTSWESQQIIALDGNTFRIEGIKGPRADPFKFELVIDNRTMTEVDLGRLGGMTDATAEIKGNSLITYIHDKNTGEHFLTASRTVMPGGSKMIYKTLHIPSNTTMVSNFDKTG